MGITITDTTLARFLEYARDAGNWGGSPLVGGNVGGEPADRGYLTNMKKAGLVTTWEDRDVVNGRKVVLAWIVFTDAGKALAATHGISL